MVSEPPRIVADTIWREFNMPGILGIIHLVLFIIGLLQVIGSGMDTGKKILWILIILFLPIIGLILWFVIGKKT
jgi:hypothetical protein